MMREEDVESFPWNDDDRARSEKTIAELLEEDDADDSTPNARDPIVLVPLEDADADDDDDDDEEDADGG
jgi:hypothetical protein